MQALGLCAHMFFTTSRSSIMCIAHGFACVACAHSACSAHMQLTQQYGGLEAAGERAASLYPFRRLLLLPQLRPRCAVHASVCMQQVECVRVRFV
jgi:hypothetical protein